MWIKNVFYAVLIFSVVFMSFMLVHGDLSQKYNVPIEDNDIQAYVKINESLSKVRNMSDTMYRAQYTDTNSYYLMTKETIKSLRLIFAMPEMIMSVFSLIGAKIGIPGWIIGTISAAILVTIVLYFISVFAKRGWGD